MLYISFKCTEQTVCAVDAYFNFNYSEEWLDDELVKHMILDVDKSTVISSRCIESPVLGQIPVTQISGGVKALILLLKEPELEIWATACGDNCAKWIIEISKLHDIHIVLEHVMEFPADFEAVCVDNNKSINNLDDYWGCVLDAFGTLEN